MSRFFQPWPLRYMGTPPSFSATFSKGDKFRDFLFVYLEDEIFLKWGLLLKNLLQWEQILNEMTPQFIWEAIVKMTDASSENVP